MTMTSMKVSMKVSMILRWRLMYIKIDGGGESASKVHRAVEK